MSTEPTHGMSHLFDRSKSSESASSPPTVVSSSLVTVNLDEPRIEEVRAHLLDSEWEHYLRTDADLHCSIQPGWASQEEAGRVEEKSVAELQRLHGIVRERQGRRQVEAVYRRRQTHPGAEHDRRRNAGRTETEYVLYVRLREAVGLSVGTVLGFRQRSPRHARGRYSGSGRDPLPVISERRCRCESRIRGQERRDSRFGFGIFRRVLRRGSKSSGRKIARRDPGRFRARIHSAIM